MKDYKITTDVDMDAPIVHVDMSNFNFPGEMVMISHPVAKGVK